VKRLALILTLAGCGDNIVPASDAGALDLPPVTGNTDGYEYDPTWNPGDPDEPSQPTPPEVHRACCNGLLHGNVPHECVPPPGLCRVTICSQRVLEACH
jgi:hypothetical protein